MTTEVAAPPALSAGPSLDDHWADSFAAARRLAGKRAVRLTSG
jgi:hypothetical protein